MRTWGRIRQQAASEQRPLTGCGERRKPLNRRFIVTEGVFAATGELAPLQAMYALKLRFKYRMIVDESFALGVLGEHGRGACEHFGLQPGQVEIVCASLGEHALRPRHRQPHPW